MQMKNTLSEGRNRFVLYTGLLAAFFILLWVKLGSIPNGYSPEEVLAANNSQSLSFIFHNPINAPFYLVTNLLTHLGANSLLATRISSMLVGLATLFFFFVLVKRWHGEKVAVIGTLLFGASAWFLHTARLGDPASLMFGILMLVSLYIWLNRSSNPWLLLAGFILTAAMLYVPGMVVFIALGVIAQWRHIDRLFKKNLWVVTLGGLLTIAALAPLGLAIYHSPDLAKTMLGMPTQGWPAPLDLIKNFIEVPINLFVHGPNDPVHWLGRIPIIDFFTSAMFFLGGYLYLRHSSLGRVKTTAQVLLVGWVLVSLGGSATLSLIVPFIYIIAASGVGFMLDRWLAVFPRNIIAQYTGYAIMGLALVVVGWYSLTQYFVAWNNSPQTRQAFTHSVSDTIRKQ